MKYEAFTSSLPIVIIFEVSLEMEDFFPRRSLRVRKGSYCSTGLSTAYLLGPGSRVLSKETWLHRQLANKDSSNSIFLYYFSVFFVIILVTLNAFAHKTFCLFVYFSVLHLPSPLFPPSHSSGLFFISYAIVWKLLVISSVFFTFWWLATLIFHMCDFCDNSNMGCCFSTALTDLLLYLTYYCFEETEWRARLTLRVSSDEVFFLPTPRSRDISLLGWLTFKWFLSGGGGGGREGRK